MIDYRIKTTLKQDLYVHFQKCDTQFEPPLSDRVSLKEYSQKLNKYSVTFEAWNTSELIGLISVYLNDIKLGVGFISNVSVLIEYEKMGIASRLIKMVKNYAIDLNFSELSLEVNNENIEGIDFYLKHGFKQQSKEENITVMNCILKK